MGLQVFVRGGTGAGRRTLREGLKSAWTCVCGTENARYLKRCRECRAERA